MLIKYCYPTAYYLHFSFPLLLLVQEEGVSRSGQVHYEFREMELRQDRVGGCGVSVKKGFIPHLSHGCDPTMQKQQRQLTLSWLLCCSLLLLPSMGLSSLPS